MNFLENLTEEEKQVLFLLLCLDLKERDKFNELLDYAIKLYKQKDKKQVTGNACNLSERECG
jgi:hypothetical protein